MERRSCFFWKVALFLFAGFVCTHPLYVTADEPTVEFRALFMATVANIDWPRSSNDTVEVQRSDLIEYLDIMQASKMNALMFQVRTSGDALYSSEYEPWSKYLTGTQGTAPSPLWDPLEVLVSEAHQRNIEVHAWLNPYRANLEPNWDGLAPNHMANVFREYAYPYDTYLWMDPGADQVIERLISVVVDIATRYDVDGIHFDDYFYPYPDGVGTPFPDDVTYQRYVEGGGSLPRDDWRRNNVDKMIERVYTIVKSIRPGLQFSLSPFGLYRPGDPSGMPPPITGFDPYSEIYADALLWLQQGWVDFMAPQLYWAINSTGQSYPTLLDWWLDHNPASKNIYAANGVYRITSWPVSEIEEQIAISRDPVRRDRLSLGNIMFSAQYFRDNTKGITDAFRERVYTVDATTPPVTATVV